MKLGSANLLKAGKRELRSLGDDCDDACFPAYCCGNFELHGICRGFKLLNGENRKKLNAMLTDDDVLYIESCMRMIQNGHNEDVLVPEVLRYLKRPEDPPRENGFTAMLTAARSSNPTPQYTEPETEERATSGFQAMILASCRGKREQPLAVVTRQLEYTFPDETHSRTPYGFSEMLDSAFPHGNRMTPEDRPHVFRRSMGFASMLEGARRGTE
jgi:hypothetical protein